MKSLFFNISQLFFWIIILSSTSIYGHHTHPNYVTRSDTLVDYQDSVDIAIAEFKQLVEKGDLESAMKSSYQISNLYVNYLLEITSAVDYTIETLNLANELNNSEYQILALQQMAYIHYSWSEIDNAIAHYIEALEIAEKTNNYQSITNICVYLSSILEEEYRIKEALIYFEKIVENEHNVEHSPQALMTIGNYYQIKDQIDSTFHYYSAALSIFSEQNNYRWESYLYSKLAGLSLSVNQYNQALDYASKGLEIAENYNCKKERYDNYKVLADIYENTGNYKNSLYFFKQYSNLKDSIYSSRTNQNVEFLQLKLKLKEEEKEISTLLNEKKLSQIEVKNERYISFILFFGIALLFSLMALIYYRLRVIRKQNIEIGKSYRNEVSLVQEKETLLKEVHHRVKNNMQIISSLLSLQQSGQKDEKIIELFEQSKYRIQAMAMVHEMLYQKENMGLIQYEGYLNKLGSSLITALSGNNCEIDLSINAPEINLNIDTAVPLGLIINEILTNSIKYGFKDKTSGKIYVNIENIGNKKLILKIGDDGIGFDFEKQMEKSDSLGLQLIETLSDQLDGKVQLLPKKGTHYLIAFEEA